MDNRDAINLPIAFEAMKGIGENASRREFNRLIEKLELCADEIDCEECLYSEECKEMFYGIASRIKWAGAGRDYNG